MPIEDILYQAYLIILSWPVQEEVTSNNNNTADSDIDNPAESNLL